MVAEDGLSVARPWVANVAEDASGAGVGPGVLDALLDEQLPKIKRTRALACAVAALLDLGLE